MIAIREAVPEDAPAIRMLSEQLGYSLSEEQTLQNITALKQSDNHEIFVAVDDKVIGWIGMAYTISVESPPGCMINGLVVDENYRSRGVGKMLIEKAKEWAREKGMKKLRLRCNVKRTEAHNFYVTAGFTEIKQQKVFEINL